MARLQDFNTVTPTDNDNLLVVQATGQGLATVGSTLGAKLDKANPTGTGSLSLNRTGATGNYSTALGYECEASKDYSTATGIYTVASGERSVATGARTKASGADAVAEGYSTTASGSQSHSAGKYTTANRQSQFVFGEWNVLDTGGTGNDPTLNRGTYVEIVGKGTSDASRSNARTLDWNGNEVLAGGLKINGNQDVVTGISESILTTSTTGTQSLITGKNLADYRFVLICLESGYVLYDTSLIPYNLFKTGFSLLTRVDSSNYARITYSSDTTITVNQLAGSYSLRIYGVK